MAIEDCTCARCGAVTSGKKYCSDRCKRAAADARRPNRKRTPNPSRGPFVCRHCSSEYHTTRHKGEGENYCSRACYQGSMKAGNVSPKQYAAMDLSRLIRTEAAALAKIRDAWSGAWTLYADCNACGQRFRRIGGSLRCQPCRVAATARPCRYCKAAYYPTRKSQQHCTSECAKESRLSSRRKAKAALAASGKLRAYRKKAKAIRRARKAISAELIDPVAVLRRDHWRCHICGARTPESLRGTYDDRAPELDHLVALADGGSHTWANVACACRRCNIAKGAASFGQLNLGWAA